MRVAETPSTGIPRPALASCEDQYRTLMVRYQAGDAEAVAALYSQLTPALRAYLDRVAPDSRGERALVDRVFLAIHDARRSYNPRRPFGGWVTAIARHVAQCRWAEVEGAGL